MFLTLGMTAFVIALDRVLDKMSPRGGKITIEADSQNPRT
jgi:hypothetical protein